MRIFDKVSHNVDKSYFTLLCVNYIWENAFSFKREKDKRKRYDRHDLLIK